MKRFYLGAAAALLFVPLDAAAYREFCEDPGFVMRAHAPAPEKDLTKLLTKQEKLEPGSFERLFSTQGPYGHQELGFRYLAKAFGYPGGAWGVRQVEAWLAERELKEPEFAGTYELWRKWVREPSVLLKAKGKPESTLVEAYFREPAEAVKFSQCVANELARSRCENFLGKKLKPKARVYYAQTETSRQPCRMHYNGGNLEEEVPERAQIPVRQYYQVQSRSGDKGIVKVEGTKTFNFQSDFNGKDDKEGPGSAPLPAK